MRLIPLLLLGLARAQCDEQAVLGRLIRSAYSRLIAVHCATGENESKTKRLSMIDNPIEANSLFW